MIETVLDGTNKTETGTDVESAAAEATPVEECPKLQESGDGLSPSVSLCLGGLSLTRDLSSVSASVAAGGSLAKSAWPLITNYRFVKSEREEVLLQQAKTLWRKRVPRAIEPYKPQQNVKSLVGAPACNGVGTDGAPAEKLDTPFREVPTVMEIDFNVLPNGQVSRLWVTLAEDGLNCPIKVPVIIAKGVKSGPCVGTRTDLPVPVA